MRTAVDHFVAVRFCWVLALFGNELPETNFLPAFALPWPGVSNGDTDGSSTRTPHELVVGVALRFRLLALDSLIEQTVCLVSRRVHQALDFERFSQRFCSKRNASLFIFYSKHHQLPCQLRRECQAISPFAVCGRGVCRET